MRKVFELMKHAVADRILVQDLPACFPVPGQQVIEDVAEAPIQDFIHAGDHDVFLPDQSGTSFLLCARVRFRNDERRGARHEQLVDNVVSGSADHQLGDVDEVYQMGSKVQDLDIFAESLLFKSPGELMIQIGVDHHHPMEVLAIPMKCGQDSFGHRENGAMAAEGHEDDPL